MPRRPRACPGRFVYHVLNRRVGRMTFFGKSADYEAFERVLAGGLGAVPFELLGWCVMGNGWHRVLPPREADALGPLMGWVGVNRGRAYATACHGDSAWTRATAARLGLGFTRRGRGRPKQKKAWNQ
jgi:hypothetical protein